MYETVVVASDDSQTAHEAVVTAAEVAKLAGGKLHIVTAYDPKSVRIEHLPAELQHSTTSHPADVLLKELARIGEERGLEVGVHAATGDAADAIVRVAEQESADLVVVGNKGMRGVRRILGSVPNKVAHGAPCSVLIVDTVDSVDSVDAG